MGGGQGSNAHPSVEDYTGRGPNYLNTMGAKSGFYKKSKEVQRDGGTISCHAIDLSSSANAASPVYPFLLLQNQGKQFSRSQFKTNFSDISVIEI